MRSEKQSKMEKLDEKLVNIGERLVEFSDDSHSKFQGLKEQLTKFFSLIDGQNSSIESSYEQKMQYLNNLEEKVVERFEQESKLRREMEKKAILLIDERYNFLVNEMNKEIKNRNESLDTFHKIIENDIPKIQENLKEEQNEMNDNDTSIANKITEETQRLINLVQHEKNAREETEEALLEMLKAMINAMKSQLENEKRERRTTQDYLINLLEDMCVKISKANDVI